MKQDNLQVPCSIPSILATFFEILAVKKDIDKNGETTLEFFTSLQYKVNNATIEKYIQYRFLY